MIVCLLGFSTNALAQAASDTPFQVRFASNLKKNDVIRVANTGANGGQPLQLVSICANLYAFAPAGTLLDCCSCSVPGNGFKSVSIALDLLADRKPRPKDVLLKALATRGKRPACATPVPPEHRRSPPA
jgi:hypothetical protein